MDTTSRTPGFTLIELLVVVAVLSILLALLVPLGKRAMYVAKDVNCRSNMRQQAAGLLQYINDHRHYPMCHQVVNGRVIASWVTQIRRYTGDSLDLFNDPVMPEDLHWRWDYGPPGGDFASQAEVDKYGYRLGERLLNVHRVPFTYGYNDWGAEINRPDRAGYPKDWHQGIGSDGWDYPYVTFAQVTRPGQQIAIACNGEPDGSWDFNIDPFNPREMPGAWHRDGANIVFADCHVEWMLRADFVRPRRGTPEGDEIIRLWNRNGKPHIGP